MESESFNKKLDEWLDRASSDFGKADIRPGFESRIVADFHDRIARKPFWLRWQALAAAATAVILLFWVFSSHFTERSGDKITSSPVEEPRIGLSQNPGSTPTSVTDVVRSPGIHRSKVVVARHVQKSLPRQAVFPSTGLSNQERLLLTYARSVSSANIIASEDDGESHPIQINKLDTPKIEISQLQIELIRIEPLP